MQYLLKSNDTHAFALVYNFYNQIMFEINFMLQDIKKVISFSSQIPLKAKHSSLPRCTKDEQTNKQINTLLHIYNNLRTYVFKVMCV